MISQEEKDKIAQEIIEKEKQKRKDKRANKLYAISLPLVVIVIIVGYIIAVFIIETFNLSVR